MAELVVESLYKLFFRICTTYLVRIITSAHHAFAATLFALRCHNIDIVLADSIKAFWIQSLNQHFSEENVLQKMSCDRGNFTHNFQSTTLKAGVNCSENSTKSIIRLTYETSGQSKSLTISLSMAIKLTSPGNRSSFIQCRI